MVHLTLIVNKKMYCLKSINFKQTEVCNVDWSCICFFCFFSVRLLSVLRGHSVFSSPPQRPMPSDFEGFSIPGFIHYIYFPILILVLYETRPNTVAAFLFKRRIRWFHLFKGNIQSSCCLHWNCCKMQDQKTIELIWWYF